MEKGKRGKENFVVTPWKVSGNVDYGKLIREFGVKHLGKLPDIFNKNHLFRRKIIFSHRDFDKFFKALKKGGKCAIVSGVNASGTLHIGHKAVFDTNLFFQKREFNEE